MTLHLHRIIFTWLVCLAVPAAIAQDAGRVTFTVGEASIHQQAAETGRRVQVGDPLTTGANGYIYLKTIDNGFLILRPNSSARIAAYRVDPAQAGNNQIKIELHYGVARHISGEAAKSAPQNFRFNTPLAVIGVRGTDFTVYTSQNTTRIAVAAGGVVVSGFGGSCSPDGHGPCEGGLSRELFANPMGQVLQVSRGQVAPQLLPGSGLLPNLNAPPRSDEPATKTSNADDPTLSPRNTASFSELVLTATPLVALAPPAATPASVAPVAIAVPPISIPVPVVVLPSVPTSPPQVMWGRWQAVLGQAAEVDIGKLQKTHDLLGLSGNYVLWRDQNALWQVPAQNAASFALRQFQAVILDEPGNVYTAATLENAQLNVNFANSTFSTRFELVTQNERFARQAQGVVGRDGQLAGNSQFSHPTNMAVRGVLSSDQALRASYLFQTRIDDRRIATGATAWTPP